MIGVGWEEDGAWCYKNYTCKSTSYAEEYRIMDEFVDFLVSRGNPKMYYWCAESKFWDAARRRQSGVAANESNPARKHRIAHDFRVENWADLFDVFRKEPIVIKDCFKYNLKHVAKIMRKHRMIETELESRCGAGLTAMIRAHDCYKHPNPLQSEVMKDVVKYNEFDCKVLWDILAYLRNNHR
jgi:hypothetical protein